MLNFAANYRITNIFGGFAAAKVPVRTKFNCGKPLALLILAISFLFVTSCTKGDPYAGISLDPSQLAEEIAAAGVFDDMMVRVSDNAAAALYSFPGAKSVVAFAGSGATAEEIIILTAEDEESADSLVTLLEARLVKRKLDFTDYNPAEQPKIDAATVMKAGKYAIYCVNADSETTSAAIISLLDNQMD